MCVCVCVCVSLCTTVIRSTAQHSSDNFPSYPSDNHHSSEDTYCRGGDCGFVVHISIVGTDKYFTDDKNYLFYCGVCVNTLTRSDGSGFSDVWTPAMNGVGVFNTSSRPAGNSGIYT